MPKLTALISNFAILLSATCLAFVAQSAQAVVLPNTSFVAQQCGAQTVDVAQKDTHVMESACVGTLSGSKTRAVQFRLANDQTYLYIVTGQSNLMMALNSGATMTIFQLVGQNGEQTTMKAIVNRDGSIRSISGDFQTNPYVIPELQQMISLM